MDYSNTMDDISEILVKLKFWHASHIPREFNFAAHNLAKWALSCNFSGLIPSSSLTAHLLTEGVDASG
jgi:hypothetical protein